MASPTPASILNVGEDGLTLPFVLIGLGIIAALLILWWGARMAARRRQGRRDLEARGEAHYAGSAAPMPRAQPPVAPSPPPIADADLPASQRNVPAQQPIAPAPPPITEAELPASPPAAEPVREPAPLADEPIAAAAAMDATPASVAASGPAPVSSDDADDFTRMKGVGPKLAERLRSLGITRFAQIAALSPSEAAALDAQLGNFQGRLQRDRWIEQASFLAAGDTAGYEAQFGRL
jgi:predicted flap endonuclease-1-like 5' DNA nuclease